MPFSAQPLALLSLYIIPTHSRQSAGRGRRLKEKRNIYTRYDCLLRPQQILNQSETIHAWQKVSAALTVRCDFHKILT
eukprot:scaffold978_cov137-Skeletonema_menzelii.AAC.3